MSELTNYIKERIEDIDKHDNWWQKTLRIAELQAVLSKLEELDSPIYRDEIVIPTYHHYRRKEWKAYHWKSNTNKEYWEVPIYAEEIPVEKYPEPPLYSWWEIK